MVVSVKSGEGDQERVRRILFVAGREGFFFLSSSVEQEDVRKRDTAKIS